ncbi:hypothetical protein ABB37_05517 [Leptomonas pyrrhocoris]|uniref:Uncharacterized protein n=1 Tax=Leptomonas pyrrhocoris TaxID=157538 RepID=A0A0M9G099_LEPPY|nr:hypothetical protein ABB37_05517 [Leptomonas pyrrhocoris]XP_015658208.1 hypothetical protein ABB37_05517 [Leptomonas pyrrhocoris]XP_015658209.1 hypothetical protein ABB37_05517 [Leptomonas pyrrhocoris]KPA79768.1 hypothetical protein ABB37_05517 [Leptomonas pyrrhocoris]KPA79769.1 hypothetical protein ABB37_05517 [Leptomonas pyrrhocoris]KPA79770.1 hypothetical protein ABB37_05517 [Leptomonas pyrrhocoris]|eukprot:XP_015658207.1 hypothetical protein ABB37_05517 [Leptomonas pyrrhocoris]
MKTATDFNALPPAVSVSTNVATMVPPPSHFALTSGELAECFLNARRSSIHTQPPPSDAKAIKKAQERLDSFHSSQMNPFLYGYLYPGQDVPDSALSGIRNLCVNTSSDWAARCQRLAFDVLTAELQAKASNVIPRANHDDPIGLAQLRRVLPTLKYVPKVSVSNPHCRFVGSYADDAADSAKVFSAKVSVQNTGSQTFTVEIVQTQTVIDGVKVENKFMEATLEKAELHRGESVDMCLTMQNPPRAVLWEYEQVVVLAVNGVLKYFVTFAVISPRQNLFKQRLPGCLPLTVLNSPLGEYSAPLMLQVLKHAFIRQEGYTSPAVTHLLLGKAVNYRPHNEVVMQETMRLKEMLSEQLNLAEMITSYWTSLPDARKAPLSRQYRAPPSSAQPARYAPGSDKAGSSSSTSADALFPNGFTRLPDVLTRCPPAVIFGVILIWLAEMDIAVFDSSLFNSDAVGYLQTMPPYLRGIVLWILDLCCGLLANQEVNGVNERVLALTFAGLLMRRNAQQSTAEESEAFSDAQYADLAGPAGNSVSATSFSMEVSFHQNAVTAMLHWITIYRVKYMKRIK